MIHWTRISYLVQYLHYLPFPFCPLPLPLPLPLSTGWRRSCLPGKASLVPSGSVSSLQTYMTFFGTEGCNLKTWEQKDERQRAKTKSMNTFQSNPNYISYLPPCRKPPSIYFICWIASNEGQLESRDSESADSTDWISSRAFLWTSWCFKLHNRKIDQLNAWAVVSRPAMTKLKMMSRRSLSDKNLFSSEISYLIFFREKKYIYIYSNNKQLIKNQEIRAI